jgi:hypothetical protein
MKCNKTLSKWCKNKHRASKIIDTFETYQEATTIVPPSATSIALKKRPQEETMVEKPPHDL